MQNKRELSKLQAQDENIALIDDESDLKNILHMVIIDNVMLMS
jgi:hypothetical protein